jgi:hypothetical protein
MHFEPAILDLGLVAPGNWVGGEVQSNNPTLVSGISLTASMLNDTSGGGFKVVQIASFVSVTEIESDPGVNHGKPIKVTSLEPVGQTNGVTPLALNNVEIVTVEITFTAPASPSIDAPTATLQINGDSSGPIFIPLKVLIGQLAVKVPPITVVQHQSITVKATITSLAGPPTTVALATDASPNPNLPPGTSELPPGIGFSITPSSVSVKKGSPASANLTVSVSGSAGPGNYSLALRTSSFGGSQDTVFVPVTVKELTLRPSPIAQKYASLGGVNGFLGVALGPEDFCPDFVGQFQAYKGGVIYWSGVDGTDAFEVHGPVLTAYLGSSPPATGPSGGLGYPTTDVQGDGSLGIFVSHFENGGLYSKPTTGTKAVVGPIFPAYVNMGEQNSALGFPIGATVVGTPQPGTSAFFGDFENGCLYSTEQGPPQLLTLTPKATVLPPSAVLDQINKVIDQAIAKYNKTASHQVVMQGGPTFQNPVLTDYTPIGATVENRQYRIYQSFFISGGICPDITIGLDLTLLMFLGGATSGGTDQNGNSTGPTAQSIAVRVTSATAAVDGHGNPSFSADQAQSAHDQIVALAMQAAPAPIPLTTLGITVLQLKMLTSGAGSGLSDAEFNQLGPGAVGVFLQPLSL